MTKLSMRDVHERRAITRRIVEPLLQGKRDRTAVSGYERVAPGQDSRVHTVLSPVGTSTFRQSSSASPLFAASTNLQNMMKKIARLDPLYQLRDAFIPDPGLVLIAGDYQSAEAVMVAAYSKDWSFYDKLVSGFDIHTEHAQHFFDIDTPTSFQRDLAKTLTYLSFYSGGSFTATERINKDSDTTGVRVTIEEITRLQSILYQLHPLQQWWETTRAELAKSGGVLRNCFGFRRIFHDPDPDYRLKDGLAFYPQSTVAWLINWIIADLYSTHPDLAPCLLLQVHDELLFQTEPSKVDSLIARLTPLYERPFVIHGRPVHIGVEWKTGASWGQMMKYSPPK
jgi:DNA polymerase I-like protein with 3'-5' exonuclease and polymerase domains